MWLKDDDETSIAFLFGVIFNLGFVLLYIVDKKGLVN